MRAVLPLCMIGLVVAAFATGLGGAETAGTHGADASVISIIPVNPAAGETIRSSTPNISATFSDSVGVIDPSSVIIAVDGTNLTGLDTTKITTAGVSCQIPSILALSNGNHSVYIAASDSSGNHAEYSWGFVVNPSAAPPGSLSGFNLAGVVVFIAVGAALVGAGVGGYILYLKRTRRFTFRRYFATHPVRREYVVLYVPAVLAFVFILLGLLYVLSTPGLPIFAPEYVVVAGLFIALTLFAVDARRQKQKVRAFERAFSQLLFEMADAMRGGIDPAKAILELSKSSSNTLQKPLRIAADGIRLGRPFDAVLSDMVAPMHSSLVSRYAQLIAEASSVGGETSAVVYRAAKDLDDFIKIEVERGKQLLMPVAVLYIAFGVLAAVLFALLYIAPTLGSINVSFVGTNPLAQPGGGGGSTPGATVPKLDATSLKQRFFDLMLILSIGIGAIIGAFTEGKARYGLLHSLGLMLGTIVAFAIIFP